MTLQAEALPEQDVPRVEGFEDLVEIGSGSFATVYRARQTVVGREVALKVLHNVDLTPAEVRAFDNECRALGKLSRNRRVTTVHFPSRTDRGQRVIVMELARQSVRAMYEDGATFGAREATRLGLQVSEALVAAHPDILHCDVKPANVLISDGGDYQLSDFGIARIVDDLATVLRHPPFTPAFAAPEVLAGGEPTETADLYSLAATVAWVLLGRVPFVSRQQDVTKAVTFRSVLDKASALRANGASRELADALSRALAEDPADRFPGVRAFGEALASVPEAATAQGVGGGPVQGGSAAAADALAARPPVGAEVPVGRLVSASAAWAADTGASDTASRPALPPRDPPAAGPAGPALPGAPSTGTSEVPREGRGRMRLWVLLVLLLACVVGLGLALDPSLIPGRGARAQTSARSRPVLPPVPAVGDTCVGGRCAFSLTGATGGASPRVWDFGDASALLTTGATQVVHAYARPGRYAVVSTALAGGAVRAVVVIRSLPREATLTSVGGEGLAATVSQPTACDAAGRYELERGSAPVVIASGPASTPLTFSAPGAGAYRLVLPPVGAPGAICAGATSPPVDVHVAEPPPSTRATAAPTAAATQARQSARPPVTLYAPQPLGPTYTTFGPPPLR